MESNHKNKLVHDDYKDNFYRIPDSTKENHPTQGDIYLFNAKVKDQIVDPSFLGIVIVSNACDIAYKKLEYYSFLPIYKIETLIDFQAEFDLSWNYWFRVFNQSDPRSFYLPPHESLGDLFGGIVEIQQIQSLPKNEIVQIYSTLILSINSPYRENLNSKIAYLFTRIPVYSPNKIIIKDWFHDLFTQKKLKP